MVKLNNLYLLTLTAKHIPLISTGRRYVFGTLLKTLLVHWQSFQFLLVKLMYLAKDYKQKGTIKDHLFFSP